MSTSVPPITFAPVPKALLRLENPMQVPASVALRKSVCPVSSTIQLSTAIDCLNGVSTLEHVLYYYCLLPRACLVRVASYFLEVAFSLQKRISKLLNNAFYAALCCQIKVAVVRPGPAFLSDPFASQSAAPG
jgi:hypothetical protein